MSILFNFGVNKETRTEQDVPFPISKYFDDYQTRKPDGSRVRPHPFAIAKFVRAEMVKYTAKDASVKEGITLAEGVEATYDQVIDEDKAPVLIIEFSDGQHSHAERFGVFKSQRQNNLKAEQIAQLYVTVTGRPKEDLIAATLNEKYELGMEDLGPNDINIGFEKYYTGVAKAFEENVDREAEFRLKLVRQGVGAGSNRRNYLQFSLGNFIEKNTVPLNDTKLTIRADDQFAEIEKPPAEDVADVPTGNPGAIANDPWAGSNM